jgi:hypothetical protein
MQVRIVTDFTTEPVTLAEAKTWMRINEFTSDDTLITALIKSTRLHLEKFTGLSFGVKTLETIFETDLSTFELPYTPLVTLTTLAKKTGVNEWETLVVNEDYEVMGNKILLTEGTYKATYQAGYSTLPEDLKTDIKVLVAWQYENRGINFGTSANIKEYPHWNLLNSRQYRKVVI